jgi:hypothetical protein
MSMVKSAVKWTLLAIGVLTATTAWAATWSGPKTITSLQTNGQTSYIVTISGSVPNPAGTCTADYFEPHANVSTTFDAESINKTLLAAFLAGRQVDFLLSEGSCGPGGRPAYTKVKIQ